MKLNLSTLSFGSYIDKGGGTPSWGTELGQSKPDYKFTVEGCEEILVGMLYNSVNLHHVCLPLGKGGHIDIASNFEECHLAGVFRKVYINGISIDYPFIKNYFLISCLRPLFLLLASTLLPPLVLILALKP